ncbi:hypothetical protein [Streptomyces sp. NPDC001530]|uniref:hypothetical protein n=1 Tax=Streptomyces sp. NPDC001530 TaxID=3364582 RepID=UPI0036797162
MLTSPRTDSLAPPDAALRARSRCSRRTNGPSTPRLQHALNTFADSPRQALEEAEDSFDEAVVRLTNTLAERRRVLHEGWQDPDPDTQSDGLRLALRGYREITQRLLRM